MMPPFWKEAPFLRLIVPFIAGIITEWYGHLPVIALWSGMVMGLAMIVIFNYLKLTSRFRYYYVSGSGIHLLLFFSAALLTYNKNIRNDPEWIGHLAEQQCSLVIRIEEPLSERPKTYKAIARVEQVIMDGSRRPAKGRVILYFKKDSAAGAIAYGTRLLVALRLQPVKNFTPSFDYQTYCALQNIFHQAYLRPGEYTKLPGHHTDAFTSFLLTLRKNILAILTTYIPGKREAGLAEALLIGYKDDLDKSLLQSYASTGVVHVIAISGLHVGLIYSILLLITTPINKRRYAGWVRPLILLGGLWIFSLLAGGSPSVLRSALMFTVMVAGNSFDKKCSVYNSLGISAFLLLCFNPLWLWDIGFQLSYIAVLSILLFMKPVYHLLYIQNKLLDLGWQMVAVTLAAQLLTTPICMYYFHQFPNLFLVTNLVAVPLSSLILIGELLLCTIAFAPPAAAVLGTWLQWLIKCMNDFIIYIEKMPFALTNGIHLTLWQAIILYLIIAVAAQLLIRSRSEAEFS